ncbi:MAG: type 4a pilus biogenesis protein PilO, partial [candidate division NC10 bacterium]|nr:type 4a pilus biogenesis protein PilO [candidate division NC10 bacterium]
LNVAAIVALDLPLRRQTLAREEGLYALQGELRGLRHASGRAEAAGGLEREISRLRGTFPPRREVVALVRDLSARAASARLKVGGIDYKPADVPEEGLLRLGIAMGVEGSYTDLRRFLADLEGMRGRLAITHLAATGRPGEGHVSARLTLTAYFQAGEPRLKSSPAAAAEEAS